MDKNTEIVIGNASYNHFSKDLEEMIAPEAENGKMLKWSEADLRKTINDGNSVLVLANKEIVGFICLILYREYVEISALIVAPKYRRKGIATTLMEKSIDSAKEKYSDKKIILFANEISFQLSQRFNFVIVDKESLDIIFWKACDICPEYKNFPNCHCQPMMLE